MRSNDGATFIQSLQDRVESAILDALTKYGVKDAQTTAQNEARAVVLDLIYEWGGDQVYIPLKSDMLNAAIYEEMQNGAKASRLASKYRIAKSTVYKIYHAEREKRAAMKQATLPGV